MSNCWRAVWCSVLVQGMLWATWAHVRALNVPNDFKLNSVSKVDSATGVRLTLTYEATSKPHVVFRHTADASWDEIAHELGTVELEVSHTYSDVVLILGLPDIMYVLNIRPWVSGPREETLPNMKFVMQPGRDVIYTGRDDAVFSVTVNFDGHEDEVYYDSLKWNILVKSASENGDTVFDDYYWFSGTPNPQSQSPLRLVSPAHEKIGGFYEFQLDTSSHIEGIAELTTFDQFNAGDEPGLLKSLQTLTSVRFYRAEQEGTFLSDSVGFVHNGPGDESRSCEVYPNQPTTCYITCSAVGGHPSDIQIVKLGPEGERTRLNSTVNYRWLDHRVDAVAAVRKAGAGDAGEYRCVANSTGGSAAAEKSIVLHVVQRPSIVKDRSYAMRQADGTLVARCVAEGIPAPSVSFTSDNFNTPLADMFGPRHDVIVTQLSATLTQATLRIPDPVHSLQMTYVLCHARNESPYTSVRTLDVIDV